MYKACNCHLINACKQRAAVQTNHTKHTPALHSCTSLQGTKKLLILMQALLFVARRRHPCASCKLQRNANLQYLHGSYLHACVVSSIADCLDTRASQQTIVLSLPSTMPERWPPKSCLTLLLCASSADLIQVVRQTRFQKQL